MNKPADAVDLIVQFLSSRRNKAWTKHHEKLINLFVDIALELCEPNMVKDGLTMYRNITQQSNPQSLSNVIKRLFVSIDAKITEAELKAKSTNLSSEILLLNQVDFKTSEERAKEHFVSPWISFGWDCQRNVLDVLQGHSAFQPIYHNVLKTSHEFLLKFERTREFRMMCHNVSKHFFNVVRMSKTDPSNLKPWQKFNQIKITNEFTLMTLNSRLSQLETASKLKMWMQVVSTIVDISNVVETCPSELPPYVMAKYYGVLADVMWKANNKILHAYCMFEEYMLRKRNQRGFDGKEMASKLILAALCIPSDTSNMSASAALSAKKNAKMANFMFLTSMSPSRSELLSLVAKFHIDRDADKEISQLFSLLRDRFNPFDMVERISMIIKFMKEKDSLRHYVTPMKRLVIIALMKQLSQVFKTVRMSKFRTMISGLDMSYNDVEMAAVQASRARLFTVCINHKSQTLHFTGRGVEDKRVKSQLCELSLILSKALKLVKKSSGVASTTTTDSKQFFQNVRNTSVQIRPDMLSRKAMIRQMREDREKEEIAQQQAIEEERERAEEERKQQELQRLEDEKKQRERDQKEKEEKEKKRAQAVQKAKDVLGSDFKIDVNLTVEEIDNLREKHILDSQKAKNDKKKKKILKARNIDFEVRALREAEQPLVLKHFEEQVEQSNAEFGKQFDDFKKASLKRFEKNTKLKARWSKLKSTLDEFTNVLVSDRTDLEIRLKRKRSKIERAEGREREEKERIRREEEEEDRRRQEAVKRAEERRQKDEEEKERRRQEAAKRAEERRSQGGRSGKYVPPSQRNRENRESNNNRESSGRRRWNDDKGDDRKRQENGGNRWSSRSRHGDDDNTSTSRSGGDTSSGKWRPSGRWRSNRQ